jgi:hypothetical protein
VSKIIETKFWLPEAYIEKFINQPDYLNIATKVKTELDPFCFLDKIQ